LIFEQLIDVTLALKALDKGVDADKFYEEVMKVEGYDDFMLAYAFDHLMGDEKVARAFLMLNFESFGWTTSSKIIELRIWVLSICSNIRIREKYILAPQTTTHSPDGPPNYQCLDSGPPNYHFLIFWPHPSIYAVNSKQNSENTPPTL
jgi:hypothetical protein